LGSAPAETGIVYIGNIYERGNGTTVRKYYYAGGVRIAMRTGGQTYYLLGDHLGGTNVTANSSGVQISKLLYRPWGETRVSTGKTPTTWRFTGQREDGTIGLYFYNARYYDPLAGRFIQPDTIVPAPGNPQALNRYSYVLNNPVRYTDPTGHFVDQDISMLCSLCRTWEDVRAYYLRQYGAELGEMAYSLLKNPAVSFASIMFAGSGDDVGVYGFILRGDADAHFRMALWDMGNGREADLSQVLSSERITVWSTNTEVKEGGYFYTGWDKGFNNEVAAEAWRQPWQSGFGDFSVNSAERFTGYRVYTDWNGWVYVTLGAAALGKPDTPAAFGALVVDLVDAGINLRDKANIDRRYPLLYTGNEWLGHGAPSYFSWRPPTR